MSDKQETKQELLAQQTILHALVENVQQGVLFEDEARCVHFANRKFCDLFGIPSPEAISGADCAAIAQQAKHSFADPEGFISTIERRLAERRLVLSDELTLADGRIIERDYIPVTVAQEQRCHYWIYRDITGRKRAEENLHASEERQKKINKGLLKLGYDHNRNLQLLTGLCGELLYADCALYNRLEGELLCVMGQWAAPPDLKTEDAPKGHICFDVIQRNSDEPLVIRHLQDTEYAKTDPNVSAYGLHTYIGFPVRFGGIARGSLCVVYTRDYTPSGDDLHIIAILAAAVGQEEERALSQESLRKSEEFIRSILDNVDEGFLVIDRDYRIISVNRAYCAWVGEQHSDIIGKHCYDVSHGNLRPCNEQGEDCVVKRAFETGEPQVAVHKHKDTQGNILYVETKAFPLRDTTGTVTSAIETIYNITERHLLEAEQLKTQKLEAIGTLAGGIAHDFNNLLQGVFGYMSMAKLCIDNREKALAMLDQAESALNMSVNLTGQLLTFSKGGKPVKKRLALPAVIENSVKFALSGSRSKYRITADKDLRHVDADEGQIGQVIQNIVLNANEAMPDGGTIEISAGNMDIPKGGNPSFPEGGRFVLIAIRDSGVGIAEQYLPRIFDPYFTTKQKGSGLGLASSYSIIRNHGGAIEVTSEPNKGSTFFIYLPASDPEEQEKAQCPVSSEGRKGRVLLMDDEEMVRNVAVQMIEALGHKVETAWDGEGAIETFRRARESGKPFDVVILDLTIKGGMGGEQAVIKLREIDPNVKAVVSSGYADNPVVSDYRSYGFSAFLNKPYRINALRESLNALLGGS